MVEQVELPVDEHDGEKKNAEIYDNDDNLKEEDKKRKRQ